MRSLLVKFTLPADGPSWDEFEDRLRSWIAADGKYGGTLRFMALWGESVSEFVEAAEAVFEAVDRLAGERRGGGAETAD